MADDEDKTEAESLIVAYLTSNLNKYPNGVTLQEFEKNYHIEADEDRFWYRRYGKNSPSEVLDWIKGNGIRVHFDPRSGNTFISLNRHSDKVDAHLVDLVANQKSSSKRKRLTSRGHFLQRSYDDFYRMNRNYSSHDGNRINPRLNAEPRRFAGPSGDLRRGGPLPPPLAQPFSSSRHLVGNNNGSWSTSSAETARVAPQDPRASRVPIPPQVSMRTHLSSSPSIPPVRPVSSSIPAQRASTSTRPPQPTQSATIHKEAERDEDPSLVQKKSHVRQRLLHMLTKKYFVIKLLYLGSMYQLEYHESLDPIALGYKDLTRLLEDSFFGEYIKINYSSKPLVTVSARNICNEKENIASNDGNRLSGLVDAHEDSEAKSNIPLSDRSNNLTGTRAKYNAIDIFNVSSMLNSLNPLQTMTEPPLGNNQVEECVKFRTLRTIISSPDKTLKLDDWDLRYQEECKSKIRIQIRDYGFKTLLEFFKHLAKDLPIKIRLNSKDEWIAVADINSLSGWIKKNMSEGNYRVITVLNRSYEQIAYPNDTYKYADLKDLPDKDFHQANIMSVKCDKSQGSQRYDMWIQMRTYKRIEEHLSIEGSMVCYEDFKRKDWIQVPPEFIVKGFPCVAYDEMQQRWCRASIVKVPQMIDQKASVSAFLVDYGLTKAFTLSQLRCILKNHLKHPIGLIYARIHNVNDEKSLAAKMILQEFVNPPVPLACKIVASFETGAKRNECLPKQCYTVTLVDTRHEKTDCNLADAINSYNENSPDE